MKVGFTLFCFLFTLAHAHATEINLIITSDQHGWLSSSYYHPNRKVYGLLHLEPAIKKLQKADPESLLLDGGDTMQGSPLVTYFNHHNPSNNLYYQKLKELNYLAIAIGNHDLEENPTFEQHYTQDGLFIAANLYRKGKTAFLPYKVTRRKGVKIVILGLTTTGLPLWIAPSKLRGLEAKDMVLEAEKWITEIKDQENPDLIIALIHSGTNPFRGDEVAKSRGIPPPNQAYQLLKATKGIDFAISGHDHRKIPYRSGKIPTIGKTPFVAPGQHNKGLIHVVLKGTKKNNRWSWKAKKAQWYYPEQNSDIGQKYQKSLPKAYKIWLNQPLPYKIETKNKTKLSHCFNQALSLAVIGENQLDGTMLPLIQLKSTRSLQGQITRKTIIQLLRYDNQFYQVKLNQRQIEVSSIKPSNSNRKQAYNQRFFLKLHQPFPKIEQGYFLHKPSFENKYSIILSGYHLNGGGGVAGRYFFPNIKEAKFLGESLRTQLFDWLLTKPSLPKSCINQLKLIG